MEAQEAFDQFVATGEIKNAELQLKRKDGSPIDVSLNVSAVRDDNGKVLSSNSVWREITERIKLEEQLRQTQKLEAIGTLAGGIAHDFNNILFAILGNADLASASIPENSPARENLQEVVIASNRAAELVRQILTFARKAEKQSLPLEISLLVKEAVKLLRSTLPTTIEISLQLNTEKSKIKADPIEIHQVVMNLCTNASHAMMDCGGVLDIKLEEVEVGKSDIDLLPTLQAGSYLLLSVSDTGIGMPPEVQERIFEPFFTTKETGQGTGMGLSVVHGIVKDLGGAVSVSSVIGQGTTFKIFIPLASEVECKRAPDSTDIPRGTEHLMVLDDEPVLGKMLKAMLEKLGYSAEIFSNSEQALETYLAAPERFDVIITDQTMPNLTGAELAKKVIAQHPKQQIILTTGFSQAITKDEAKQIGIAAYIVKPVQKLDLAVAIRKALDGS